MPCSETLASNLFGLLLRMQRLMNRRMAEFYGVPWVETQQDFAAVPFEPERRAGVISHPLLLSGLAYTDSSSPIHRGVFLTRAVPKPARVKPVKTPRA